MHVVDCNIHTRHQRRTIFGLVYQGGLIMRRVLVLVPILWLGMTGTPLAATALQAEGIITCAVISSSLCEWRGRCRTRRPREANLPEFVTLNFADETYTATYEPGRTEQGQINTTDVSERTIIIQSLREDQPTSALIKRQSGEMVTAGANARQAWVEFGSCKQTR